MATVGHFISMLGVFFFYATLLESTFERKLTPITYNLISRSYVDSSFLYLKKIQLNLKKKNTTFIKKKTRIYLKKHIN
jgi:hypothetical protein